MPAVPSAVLAADVETGNPAPDEIRSLASNAFARAAAHAAAQVLHPGQYIDVLV